jgi:hypothetical protein
VADISAKLHKQTPKATNLYLSVEIRPFRPAILKGFVYAHQQTPEKSLRSQVSDPVWFAQLERGEAERFTEEAAELQPTPI